MIDKPAGMTSHDVVARVRRAAGGRIGHAGTLDPFATGVLVLCVGRATRLAEFTTSEEKRYLAEVTLGVETDTYDATGRILATGQVEIARAEVEVALASFVGTVEQRPPMYSAVQVAGRRLYDLARRGQTVQVAPRRVTIVRLTLTDFSPPRLTLDLTCSKGTYVRSLAHDLGTALGTGAHLSALRRLASGDFDLGGAVGLDDAVRAIGEGGGPELLKPLEVGVKGLPRIDVSESDLTRLRNGLPIDGSPEWTTARAHALDGALVAILEARRGAWWPRKVL